MARRRIRISSSVCGLHGQSRAEYLSCGLSRWLSSRRCGRLSWWAKGRIRRDVSPRLCRPSCLPALPHGAIGQGRALVSVRMWIRLRCRRPTPCRCMCPCRSGRRRKTRFRSTASVCGSEREIPDVGCSQDWQHCIASTETDSVLTVRQRWSAVAEGSEP